MKFMVKLVVLILVVLLPVMACALGPSISKSTAVWDANSETDLAGYYLYWRTPTGTFQDANRVTVAVSSTPSKKLTDLNLASGVYVIAVSAYDTELNESGLSNEVTWDAAYPDAPANTKVQ